VTPDDALLGRDRTEGIVATAIDPRRRSRQHLEVLIALLHAR